MANAERVATIVRAATSNALDVEPIDLEDAVTPAAGVDVTNNPPVGYVNGVEATLDGDARIAASTALTAGTALPLGTLVPALRPRATVTRRGAVYAGAALATQGQFTIDAAGAVAFTPDASVAATANLRFSISGVRFMLAEAFSDDVAP